MARGSRVRPVAEVPKVQAIGAATEPPPVEVVTAIVYTFPNKSRCERCGSLDTEAYKTDGPVQYRRCNGNDCRDKRFGVPMDGKFKYKVSGWPV